HTRGAHHHHQQQSPARRTRYVAYDPSLCQRRFLARTPPRWATSTPAGAVRWPATSLDNAHTPTDRDQTSSESSGHGVVFQASLGQSSVAGAAGVGDLDRLGDGGLRASSSGVLALPVGGGLFGSGLVQGFLDRSGTQSQLPAAPGGGVVRQGSSGLV